MKVLHRQFVLPLVALFSCGVSHVAFANPVDGTVVGGSAAISSAGSTLTVNQSTSKAIIDWRGFDIGAGETTQFNQPSAGAVTLNRVTSGGASQIDGALKANGNIIIVNQNGVVFGHGSTVDVNSLVATTSDIRNDDFMAGNLKFNQPGNPNATIENQGAITAKEAGLVGLVAPNVINSGTINARLGRVHLASGDSFTLDLYGDGLMEVKASDALQSQLVRNSGTINAEGGSIALTAAAGAAQVNSLIDVGGTLNARGIAERDGKIYIYAEGANAVAGNKTADKGKKTGTSAVIVHDALLDVSGRKPGERGGSITITADNVALLAGTVIDASGYEGLSNTTANGKISDIRIGAAGGDIQIGGDYLGGGITPTALNLYVDPGVLVVNDALYSGDAGRSIFWSDGTTQFYGNVYARALGGLPVNPVTWNATLAALVPGRRRDEGIGGFVETSGHEHLDAGGYVDLTASNGNRGTYFLDPTDITIYGDFSPTDVSGLQLWLDGSDQSTLFSDTGGTTQITNGGAVARWNDKSGNGRDVSQATLANRPIWNSNAQNGLGNITFGGTTLLSRSTNLLAGGNDVSFFGTTTPGASQPQYSDIIDFAHPNGGFVIQQYDTQTNNFTFVWRSGGAFSFFDPNQATQLSASQAQILSFVKNGGTATHTLNDANTRVNTGAASTIDASNSTLDLNIGAFTGGGRNYSGTISELILYNTAVSDLSQDLLNQYQSAKWGIRLTPPGVASVANDLAEANAAMAHNAGDPTIGYSVFTTDYLERLSQSANISLQASNNINLDLQGDTLNFTTANRSLTLTAGNQITTASTGAITTNSGAISFNAANGIAMNHAFTFNSGSAATTLTTTAAGGDITVSSAISTSGSGSLTLSAFRDIFVNAAITLQGGALNLNATGNVSGNSSGTINTNGGLLTVNAGSGSGTLAGIISSTGGLTKAGAGTTILSGANSYTGGTIVNNGILRLGASNVLASAGAVTVLSNLASTTALFDLNNFNQTISTLQLGGAGSTTTSTSNVSTGTGTLTLGGNVTYSSGSNSLNSTISGNLNLGGATRTFTVGDSTNADPDLTISAVISNGNIFKNGNGVLMLSGANTYTGTTAVNAGTLRAGVATSAFGSNSAVNVGASGFLDLAGFNNTIGSVTGAGTVTNSNATGATLTVGGNNTSTTFSGIIQNGTGTTALTKAGTGTLTLSGANTYTGATTVNAGTISLSGSLANTSSLTIASGATLNYVGVSGYNKITSTGVTWTIAGTLNNQLTGTNVAQTLPTTLNLNGGTLTGLGTTTDRYGDFYNSQTTTINATGSSSISGLVRGNTQLTLSPTSGSDTLQLTGIVGNDLTSGTLSLRKLGAGILTLSGANTYTGTTSVNAGTLRAGSTSAFGNNSATTVASGSFLDLAGFNNSIGSLAGAGTVTNSNATAATLTAGGGNTSTTFSGIIQDATGTTALTKAGTGTLTLSGANTYTGGTIVNNGILRLGASNALASAGTVTVLSNNGGTTALFDLNGFNQTISALQLGGAGSTSTSTNNVSTGVGMLTVGGNVVYNSNGNPLGSTISGNLNLCGATRTFFAGDSTNADPDLLISAVISNGGVNKTGTGTLTLSGANTYTGTTSVNAGTLRAGSTSAFGNNSATTVASGSFLDLAGFNNSVGSLAGAGTVTNSNATAATLTAGGDNTSTTFNGIIQDATGTTALTKVGTGTLTLSGANTYTGATNVNAGTFTYGATNALANTTAVSVASGGTFNLAGFTDTIASLSSAAGSTVTLGNGSLTSSGAQNYGGQVTGGNVTLTSTGGGAITANNTTNDFTGTVNLSSAGAVSVVNANALTLGTVSGSTIFAQTTGATADITIASGNTLTASGAGNAITLVSGRNFINAAATPFSLTGGGRWLVYSINPAANALNSLSSGFVRYGCTYGGSCPTGVTIPGGGNGLIYSFQPTLTVTPTVQNITYGNAATTSSYGYSVTSGYLTSAAGDDSTADTRIGSLTAATNTYSVGDDIGTYALNYASGTLTSALGYAFSYASNASGIVVGQRTLTLGLTGTVSKVYNGTNAASPVLANYSFGNLYAGDTGALGVTGTATYDDKNVATAKTVTVSGLGLTGAKAGNYTLASGTINGAVGTITQRALAVSYTGVNRAYDGGTVATVTTSDDRVSGDVLGITRTAAFGNKNVGTSKAVSVTGVSLSGMDAGNYSVAATGSTTADITQRALAVTYTGVNRTYDGGTVATVTTSDDRVSGDVLGITRTAAFGNKNVGISKTVNVTGVSLSGMDAGNYSVAATGLTTADITQRALAVTYTGVNRTYDGGTVATVTTSDDRVSGDVLGITRTAAFVDKNVGTSKVVNVTGVSLSGADAGNYSVAATGSTTADITQRAITLTANNQTQYYGAGNTLTQGSSITAGSLGTGDTISSVNYATDASNAGNLSSSSNWKAGNYTITASNAMGTGGFGTTNYLISYVPGTLTVNQLALAVSGISASNKVYDRTTAATITGTATYSGIISGDILTLDTSGATAQFVDENAGTSKTVSVSGLSLSGTDAANYSSTINSSGITADITPRALLVSTSNARKNAGEPNPTFIGSDNLLAADAALVSWLYAPIGFGGNPGTYTIGATATDPSNRLSNYSRTNNYGIFTVTGSATAPLSEMSDVPSSVQRWSQIVTTLSSTPSGQDLPTGQIVFVTSDAASDDNDLAPQDEGSQPENNDYKDAIRVEMTRPLLEWLGQRATPI